MIFILGSPRQDLGKVLGITLSTPEDFGVAERNLSHVAHVYQALKNLPLPKRQSTTLVQQHQ